MLWLRLQGQPGLMAWWRGGTVALDPLVGILVLLLMPLNWGLEAWKWQLLMRPVEHITYGRALEATLAGTSIGLITPNRVGEFAGRVLFLRPEDRVQGAFTTVLGSIAQFVVTLLGGSLALFLCPLPGTIAVAGFWWWPVIGWVALLLAGASVWAYFAPRWLARIVRAVPFMDRWKDHLAALSSVTRPLLVQVLLLSCWRYAVFTLQFVWLVVALAHLPWVQALSLVPVVFLVTTLVPTTALSELGVRGSVALALLPGDEWAVLASTAILWAINLVLPAITGSVILLVARIRSNTP